MGVRLGQEHRTRPEVITAHLVSIKGLGHAHIGIADDGQVLAPRIQRAERARREVEVPTHLCRRPKVLRSTEFTRPCCAMNHFNAHKTRRRRHAALREEPPRRQHRLKKRKRNRGCSAAQKRSAGKHFTGEERHLSNSPDPVLINLRVNTGVLYLLDRRTSVKDGRRLDLGVDEIRRELLKLEARRHHDPFDKGRHTVA